MSPRPIAPALAWLAVAATGACAHKDMRPMVDGAPVASTADLHRITVSASDTILEIPIAGGAESFDAETRTALLGFVRRYAAEGHGPLVISSPAGGESQTQSARRTAALGESLQTLGVPAAAIAMAAHADPFPDEARIILSFTRYVARAPDCRPVWEQNLAVSYANTAWASFGCATESNLAAMIADPRDLLTPREETPADAFRRQGVLDKYRQGQPTHATRSADERVGVSEIFK